MFTTGHCARSHDLAEANGSTGKMHSLRPKANPMEWPLNQLSQKLPILKYTRQGEMEVLSDVICMHQPMLAGKSFCFNIAKINAAIGLEPKSLSDVSDVPTLHWAS